MNYIKKLQKENEDLKNQIREANNHARHLYEYACSEKFMGEIEDQYINKNDVIRRIEPVLNELILDEINPIETEFKSIAEKLIQV